MIIPSIDIMDGCAVQLVGGKDKAIDAGDPFPIAERLALAGEIAVIDLDAAIGNGDNRDLIAGLVDRFPSRVGGGIRTRDRALEWLDAGARRVIIGTAAEPKLLEALPRERVVVALDAYHGDVMVEGWRRATGRNVLDRIAELKDLAGGFLVTWIEKEGRLTGVDLDKIAEVVRAAGDVRVTAAGGITTANEIAEIDRLGADAQVGMALYTEQMDFAEAIVAPMRSDRPDGLWPTVVVDERGCALGLAYSDLDSVKAAVTGREGVYHSRTRGLWVKGQSSGNTQHLLRIDLDCDRDALRFMVRQAGEGFCHHGSWTCWGDDQGLARLARRLLARVRRAPEGSYTKRLLDDPALLAAKLTEEANELIEADKPDDVAAEAADVIYFALVAMARAGVGLGEVEDVLQRREWRVTRRPGDAKTETNE